MLSQPPSPSQPPSSSPQLQRKQSTPVSLDQVVISKPLINQQIIPASQKPDPDNIDYNPKQPILRHPHPRRTNPLIWCSAILCLIFSIILILFGVATLIIFLSIKPRIPAFDAPNAILSSIYFDSPEYFNGDFTILANFSNPNRRIDARFEYLVIELYFRDRLIGTQAVQAFSQGRGEARLESVHFTSSLVFLPQNLGAELQKQVSGNMVNYNLRGTFKVRTNLGLIHLFLLVASPM